MPSRMTLGLLLLVSIGLSVAPVMADRSERTVSMLDNCGHDGGGSVFLAADRWSLQATGTAWIYSTDPCYDYNEAYPYVVVWNDGGTGPVDKGASFYFAEHDYYEDDAG